MLVRTWHEQQRKKAHDAEYHHDHGHAHPAHDEIHKIETAQGMATLSVFEDGVPPRFQLRFDGLLPPAEKVMIETVRPNGQREIFSFINHEDYLQSEEEIPESHEFLATLRLVHNDHIHEYFSAFPKSGHRHSHDHTSEFEDAHQKSHANDIKQRFAGRAITTG